MIPQNQWKILGLALEWAFRAGEFVCLVVDSSIIPYYDKVHKC